MAAEINELLRTSFTHCYPGIGTGDAWHNSVLAYDQFFPNAFIGEREAETAKNDRKYNLSYTPNSKSLVSLSIGYNSGADNDPCNGYPVPLTLDLDTFVNSGWMSQAAATTLGNETQISHYRLPAEIQDHNLHRPEHVFQIIRDTLSARGIGYNDGSGSRPFNHLNFMTNPSRDNHAAQQPSFQLGLAVKGDIRGFSVSYNSAVLALSGSADSANRYGSPRHDPRGDGTFYTSNTWDIPAFPGNNTIHGRVQGVHATNFGSKGYVDTKYLIRMTFGSGTGGLNNTNTTDMMAFNLALGPITNPNVETPSSGYPGEGTSALNSHRGAHYQTAFNTQEELHTTNGHQEYCAHYCFYASPNVYYQYHTAGYAGARGLGAPCKSRPAAASGAAKLGSGAAEGVYNQNDENGGGSNSYITKESDANVTMTGIMDVNHVVPVQFKWQVIYDYDNSTDAVAGLSAYSVKDVLIQLKGIGSGKPISIAHAGIPPETTTAAGVGNNLITSLRDRSLATVGEAVSAKFLGGNPPGTANLQGRGVLEWIEDKLNASINDPSLRDMYVSISSLRTMSRINFAGLKSATDNNLYTSVWHQYDGIPFGLYPIMGNVSINTIKGEDTGNSISTLPFPPFIQAYPLTEYTAATDNSDVDLDADEPIKAPFIAPSFANQQDPSRGNILIDQKFTTGMITTSGTGTIKTKIHAPYKDHWPDKTDVITGINMGIANVYRGSTNQAYIAGHIDGLTPNLADTGLGAIADTQQDLSNSVVFPGISGVSLVRHSGINFYENDLISSNTTLDALSAGKEMTITFRDGA